ncbi:MAG: hypothetical protein IJ727_00705 [Treponema sp.]|nr:hypothetical protein [Treponema sp.]
MDSKINLEEFELKQFDIIFQMKDRLESKATGYLTAVTLILSVQVAFVGIVLGNHVLQNCKIYFLLLEFLLFFVGIVELLICAWMLLPRNIWHFTSDDLEKMDIMESNDKKLNYIMFENRHYIKEIEKAVASLRFGYRLSSLGLIALVISFIVVTILFFVFVIGGK